MTEPPNPSHVLPTPHTDKYLHTFIRLVDTTTKPVTKGENPVTLMVPGGVITGTLVPQWQYARELVPAPADGKAPFEPHAQEAEEYAQRAQEFTGPDVDAEPTQAERDFLAEDQPSEHFITLGWARFLFDPGNNTESWVRVRRADVIAWHPGSLSTEPSNGG